MSKLFSKAKVNYKKKERKIMNRTKRHVKLHEEDSPCYRDEWCENND
jgi:hypothetical protein